MTMDECNYRCEIYYNCVGGCGAGKYPGCEKSKRKAEKTASVDPKRETNDGDHCEAFFHGEIWMRCHLCGKSYEAHFEHIDEKTRKKYCPWCYGYGKVSE